MSTVLEIRCSSLDRFMKCPGFAYFTDLPPNETNDAAEEGTAAGELLQSMLEQRTLTPTVGITAKNGYRFDHDMYFYVTPIANEILSKNVPVSCEQRIDWKAHESIYIRGQFDICYQIDNTLYIEDLKYGWKIVDVKENWQLLGYAIGKIISLSMNGNVPEFINFKIHQPRPHHEDGKTREWIISCNELMNNYYQQILKQAIVIMSGKAERCTGSQCRYCPAAGEKCTTFNRALNNALDVTMAEFRQDTLTEKQIADQLEILQRASQLIKIKFESLEQLACSKIKEGKVIPGYGIEEKLGDRTWNNDVDPEMVKMLTGKDLTEKVLMSPAKAEKMGISKRMIESLVTRKFTGTKIKKKDFSKDAEKAFGKK